MPLTNTKLERKCQDLMEEADKAGDEGTMMCLMAKAQLLTAHAIANQAEDMERQAIAKEDENKFLNRHMKALEDQADATNRHAKAVENQNIVMKEFIKAFKDKKF